MENDELPRQARDKSEESALEVENRGCVSHRASDSKPGSGAIEYLQAKTVHTHRTFRVAQQRRTQSADQYHVREIERALLRHGGGWRRRRSRVTEANWGIAPI